MSIFRNVLSVLLVTTMFTIYMHSLISLILSSIAVSIQQHAMNTGCSALQGDNLESSLSRTLHWKVKRDESAPQRPVVAASISIPQNVESIRGNYRSSMSSGLDELQLLGKCPSLQELEGEALDDRHLRVVGQTMRLKNLKIHNSLCGDSGVLELRRMTTLQSLTIQTKYNSVSYKCLSALRDMKDMKHLSIKLYVSPDDIRSQTITPSDFMFPSNLESLELELSTDLESGLRADDEHESMLCSVMRLQHLHTLSLDRINPFVGINRLATISQLRKLIIR